MSATFAPRKSGWTASPPRSAIRLRWFARAKRIVPASSPSTSITKTPNASGSSSERSISARISSRSFEPHRGEERLDVLVRHELDEEVGVIRAGTPDRDGHAALSCACTPKSRCPEARMTPTRIRVSPASAIALMVSSEQHCTVGDCEARHQVRDERQAATAEQPQHAEEEELSEKGRDQREREKSCKRRRARRLRRRIGDRERKEHDRPDDHRPRSEDRPRRVVDVELAVDATGCVRQRRRGRRRACPTIAHAPPSGWTPVMSITPTRPIASPTICAPRSARAAGSAAPRIATKIGTDDWAIAGDARVDVRLAPRDERQRDRGVHGAENEARAPRAAELRRPPRLPRCAARGMPVSSTAAIESRSVGHRRGRNVLDGDLDEEVRGAPHRREEQDQRPVRAHRSRLPTARRIAALRRSRPRRAAKLAP